jgi:hypothetical protein
MSNTCEYCKGVFASKNTLSQHQKKARYCLDIQLKTNPETVIDNIPCQYCGKNFTRNNDKKFHEFICKNNKTGDLTVIECEKKISIMKVECENKLKEKDIEINELRIKFEIVNSKLESEISKIEIYKELHDKLTLQK